MTSILDIAKTVTGARISGWNDRHYVNLPASGGYNGDRSTKVWIKGNVLTVEQGKGYHSDEFSATLAKLTDALIAAGAVRKGYSDSISATYTLD